jgi:NAD+ kinase
MESQHQKTFHIFYHPDNKRATFWADQINTFIKKQFIYFKPNSTKPDVVIVLGGDGTILEAARKYHELDSIILGLNLGNVGFLASVREEKDFLKALTNFLDGKFGVVERMMLSAQVQRRDKVVFTGEALNEIVIKNPLGMVELQAKIAGHPVKDIKGTGILVSTATGSTAYNLSAHGPIVMPDIKCFIVTELLDHSIPSPSLVVKHSNTIKIEVVSYRERGLISLSKNSKKIDVLLVVDGESIFPLQEKDGVIIKSSPHLIKFAELENNYFFKSLQEKFGFK